MLKMLKCVFPLLFAVSVVACTNVDKGKSTSGFVADSAMVVSAHPLASHVGTSVLLKGGNAVDAVIATQFALAVVFPAAGNIGGGGFMVLRKNDGSVYSLDYREIAPDSSNEKMFLNAQGNPIRGLSEKGHRSVGVPGSVAGMWEAHQRFGKLPWKDLVQPAINLAMNGFPLTSEQASSLNDVADTLLRYSTVRPEFLIKNWSAGDTIVWTDLGQAFERIRDDGAKGFYQGKTADDIIAEMQRGKGIITHDDLKAYKPIWRQPLEGSYKEFKIISMGPPSSGGIALLQMLKSVEGFPIGEWGHNTTRTTHLLTEIERRAYADRASHLGDPDFYNVPVHSLLDNTYIESRMKDFTPERATPSSIIKAGLLADAESHQTTHISIIDQHGDAVAVTTTLNDWFGSGIVVSGSGFILNDEMDDFSIKPGVPNMYGVTGGEANKIQPRKRMLSSMTPTIIERDGKVVMVVGTPGGSTIMTSVLQTILNVVEFKMTMQEAVSAKRLHSQWTPDVIYNEQNALLAEDSLALIKIGHRFDDFYQSGIGRVDAILVRKDGKLEGGADPRGDDCADGF
jgi:gamma-glutamyltranspeptidase / glutathione hydrolase